jgi:hypothetical protein
MFSLMVEQNNQSLRFSESFVCSTAAPVSVKTDAFKRRLPPSKNPSAPPHELLFEFVPRGAPRSEPLLGDYSIRFPVRMDESAAFHKIPFQTRGGEWFMAYFRFEVSETVGMARIEISIFEHDV